MAIFQNITQTVGRTPLIKLSRKGALAKAEELSAADVNSWIPQQFNNPPNPEAHRKTTAEEIWADTNGLVDVLVSEFCSAFFGNPRFYRPFRATVRNRGS